MRRIKSLPLSLRPREKILKLGAEALILEELISVILITGNKKSSVSQIASEIIKSYKKTKYLSKDSLVKLGIGPSKAAQILASLELSRRINTPEKVVSLTSPEQVFIQSLELIHKDKESLICFYLNARGELLKKELIAVGSLNRVNLLPREIFSLIKELPVSSIILVHNHPSGNLEPSNDDILFTKRVKVAGDILGIKLLDHLIITDNDWRKI